MMAVRKGTFPHEIAGRNCLTSFYKDITYEEWLRVVLSDWEEHDFILEDSMTDDDYVLAEIFDYGKMRSGRMLLFLEL
jgi:hypothetical protein